MNRFFASAVKAAHDSLQRINPATDPHHFNQFKALEFMAQGMDEVLSAQAREIAALQAQVRALQQRLP